jgi:hypothetical protein
MKQTAVQWALEQQHTLIALKNFGSIDDSEYFNRSSKVVEEAMKMEKQQMKRIFFKTLDTCEIKHNGSLESYFDELYYENFKIKLIWKQQ